jgi:hypothetical protein
MPKGPEWTPCARWMYCGGRELSGEQFGSSAALSKVYAPDEKG